MTLVGLQSIFALKDKADIDTAAERTVRYHGFPVAFFAGLKIIAEVMPNWANYATLL